jgi:hypothetical protein
MQRTGAPELERVGVGVSSMPEEAAEVPLPFKGWLPLPVPLPLPDCRVCCWWWEGLITPK